MTAFCFLCRVDCDDPDDRAEHELRHKMEAEKRRREYLELELDRRAHNSRLSYQAKKAS